MITPQERKQSLWPSPVWPGKDPDWPIRASLEIESGVVWCKGRIIVPESLHPRVLEILHSAHQGVSSMEDRARTNSLLAWHLK